MGPLELLKEGQQLDHLVGNDDQSTGNSEGVRTDFRRLAKLVERLEGGAYLNIGSAVILPEVFLKALAVARNWRDLVLPGTMVGLLGYAVGNYAGLAMASLVRNFLGS